jgi:hypothetical protein
MAAVGDPDPGRPGRGHSPLASLSRLASLSVAESGCCASGESRAAERAPALSGMARPGRRSRRRPRSWAPCWPARASCSPARALRCCPARPSLCCPVRPLRCCPVRASLCCPARAPRRCPELRAWPGRRAGPRLPELHRLLPRRPPVPWAVGAEPDVSFLVIPRISRDIPLIARAGAVPGAVRVRAVFPAPGGGSACAAALGLGGARAAAVLGGSGRRGPAGPSRPRPAHLSLGPGRPRPAHLSLGPGCPRLATSASVPANGSLAVVAPAPAQAAPAAPAAAGG